MVTLTSAARPPNLQKGQMTLVYESLTPYPAKRSLDDLVEVIERRFWTEYEARIKRPPLTREFLLASIRYHLRRMKDRDIVKDV
jgi:hypothetical protein